MCICWLWKCLSVQALFTSLYLSCKLLAVSHWEMVICRLAVRASLHVVLGTQATFSLPHNSGGSVMMCREEHMLKPLLSFTCYDKHMSEGGMRVVKRLQRSHCYLQGKSCTWVFPDNVVGWILWRAYSYLHKHSLHDECPQGVFFIVLISMC